MPTFEAVTRSNMNYASVVFFGVVAIASVWYWIWGYKNYSGPPLEGTHFDPEVFHVDLSPENNK